MLGAFEKFFSKDTFDFLFTLLSCFPILQEFSVGLVNIHRLFGVAGMRIPAREPTSYVNGACVSEYYLLLVFVRGGLASQATGFEPEGSSVSKGSSALCLSLEQNISHS